MSKTNFSKNHIVKIIKQYNERNPQESVEIDTIINSKESFISRKNFSGHITSSAIVLDKTLSKILLVYHKNLDKFVQPGGHVEITDKNFMNTALRELEEETGFTNVIPIKADSSNPKLPIDIDVHIIPNNKKKREPSHKHFDLRYAFVLLDDNQKKIKEDEIGSILWKSIAELKQSDQSLARFAQKISGLISDHCDEILKKKDYIFNPL